MRNRSFNILAVIAIVFIVIVILTDNTQTSNITGGSVPITSLLKQNFEELQILKILAIHQSGKETDKITDRIYGCGSITGCQKD